MIEIKRKRDTAKENAAAAKETTKDGVQLAPPWIAHYHKIQALFEHDPDVK